MGNSMSASSLASQSKPLNNARCIFLPIYIYRFSCPHYQRYSAYTRDIDCIIHNDMHTNCSSCSLAHVASTNQIWGNGETIRHLLVNQIFTYEFTSIHISFHTLKSNIWQICIQIYFFAYFQTQFLLVAQLYFFKIYISPL